MSAKITYRLILPSLAAIVISSCAASKPRLGIPVDQATREARFAVEVSQDSASQTVRDLVALGPRMGGTPSGDRAARYLEQRFLSWGLRTELVIDPEKPVHWEDTWRVDVVAADSVSLESAWPYGFSPALSDTVVAVRFVPDLSQVGAADSTLAGCAVYTHSRAHSAYETVAAAGVVAILTDAPNQEGVYEDAALIGRLPAGDNPIPVFGISRQDGRVLRRLLHKESDLCLRISLSSHVGSGHPKTLIAGLPGADTTRYYVYCAHGDSDSGGPGADDNASGEATVLETARVLSRLIDIGVLPQPRFTIRFVIWGSEYFSTENYIRKQQELGRILGVFNFDQTGTGTLRQAVYFESNEVPWNRNLMRTLDDIGQHYCHKPGFWNEYTTNPSQGGTDSYAFLPKRYDGRLDSNVQIPSTTIYTAAWGRSRSIEQTPGWTSSCWYSEDGRVEIDYSRYYHSSGDTPGNTTDLQPWRMAWAARAAGLALLRLAW